jgi:hypothetical protein
MDYSVVGETTVLAARVEQTATPGSIRLFGTPSKDEPWRWQIDRHHLSLSSFVLKDRDQEWLEEIKQHLSEVRFAWMGGFGDDDVLIRRCIARCGLLSLPWRVLWALLHPCGESVVTPSAVGSRFPY